MGGRFVGVALATVAGIALVAPLAQAAPGAWSRTAPELVDFPRDIEVSPTDPNTVYVALGDGGIAKSADGGTTWTHLGVENGLDFTKGVANAIEIDPTSSQTLYVATDERVVRSTDGGATFNAVGTPGAPGRTDVLDVRAGAGPADTTVLAGGILGKVFLSTDSGATWTDKTGNLAFGGPGNPGTIHINSIELHPTDPDVAYASSGGVLVRTTNLTLSSPTWTAIQVAPLTSVNISDLEAVSGAPDRLIISTFANGVFRSEDAGNSADAAPSFFATTGLTTGVTEITSIGTGGASYLAGAATGVFKTDNIVTGSWSELGGGLTGGESSAVGVAPSDNGVLYLHSGKLIFRSANGGISSSPRPGIVASRVSHLVSAGGRVWAGTDDGLFVSDDAGEAWSKLGLPSTFKTGIVAAAPSAPDTVLIGGAGEVRRSTDGGATFGAPAATSPGNVLDLAFDPGNADLVYGAAFFNGISVSADGGLTWVTFDGSNGLPDNFFAQEIEVAAPVGANPGVVFAGRRNTDPPIFASSDAGATWSPASTGIPPNSDVEDLAVDPSNPNIAYVTLDAFGSTPLFKTANGGGTWAEVPAAVASLPDGSYNLREVAVSPRDGRIVISADDVGTLDPPVVSVSTDGGATFAPIAPAIQHNFGSPTDIIFDDEAKGLHIATNTSGILDLGFRSDVSTSLSGPAAATAGDDLALTATVTAGGPDPVTGLSFALPLPPGVTPLSAAPSAGTCVLGPPITCTLGAPANGVPVTIAITVDATTAGNKSLVATASGNQADLNQANNQSALNIAVTSPPPDPPPDLDADDDGVPDSTDNCAAVANPDQLNTDADAEGDACDADDDGDGVADAADLCDLSAGTAANGCPDVKRTLTLVYKPAAGVFKGKLGPPGPCAASQKVKVFRKRPGPDKRIGKATTKPTGKFKVPEQDADSGTYYAHVTVKNIPSFGNCLAKKSKNLTVR